jgi:hypothetical protein
VTAARDPFPERREPVLPGHHARIGRTTMFEKEELAARLENSLDLVGSKYSGGALIELEQTAETLVTFDAASMS